MFHEPRPRSLRRAALTIADLVYHNAVRSIRKTHANAVFAIVSNIFQTMAMVVVFYFMFDILGLRAMAPRGDFLLYVMSGIFVFMTHVKAMGAVISSEGPVSPMMQHLPMTPLIAVCAEALSALYVQFVSMAAILALYHLLWQPITIAEPAGAMVTFLLAWFSGCAIGVVFLAVKPWFPKGVLIVQQTYSRVNMFASGKMFLANALPVSLFSIFTWNPLFHIIDQGRGFLFINYTPMKTGLEYPLWISLLFLAIGTLGMSYTGRQVSLSWSAGK